jgi:hypothetical protein
VPGVYRGLGSIASPHACVRSRRSVASTLGSLCAVLFSPLNGLMIPCPRMRWEGVRNVKRALVYPATTSEAAGVTVLLV